jgi:hypothetical protein
VNINGRGVVVASSLQDCERAVDSGEECGGDRKGREEVSREGLDIGW